MPNIVVVGAGVTGLTTAFLLSKNPDNNVVVVAKHMPGDLSIEYTSPWAGAELTPMAGKEVNKYEKRTWPTVKKIYEEHPEAGVGFTSCIRYIRAEDPQGFDEQKNYEASTDPWFKTLRPDWRILDASEVPEGYISGTSYKALVINTTMYLSWLAGQCRKQSAILIRGDLPHIAVAAGYHPAGPGAVDVVVNCTGLFASRLGGVKDSSVVPARGQTVMVRQDVGTMIGVSGVEDDHDGVEKSYIIVRPAGGGTLLGGTYQIGCWDALPDPDIANRIMQRAVKLCPQLGDGKGIGGLSVISHNVGLRPYRAAGVRIEKEIIDGVKVVHNYGHAGFGYQLSFGCAEEAAQLVEEFLEEKH